MTYPATAWQASPAARLPPMFRLLQETADDGWEVEALLDLAFAPGRGALSSYKLRDGVEPVAELCTIIRDEYDAVVAAIRYWPVEIAPSAEASEPGLPALLLGPIAVHPTRQGEGLGAILIGETLDLARSAGWLRVILVGDEPYYGRFGFRRALAAGLDYPRPVNENRVLAQALKPGAMDGISGVVRRRVK